MVSRDELQDKIVQKAAVQRRGLAPSVRTRISGAAALSAAQGFPGVNFQGFGNDPNPAIGAGFGLQGLPSVPPGVFSPEQPQPTPISPVIGQASSRFAQDRLNAQFGGIVRDEFGNIIQYPTISPAEAMLQTALRGGVFNTPADQLEGVLGDLSQQLQDAIFARDSAIAAGQNIVAQRYNEDIATLQAKIGDTEEAIRGTNAAFQKRNADVAPFFQAAIDAPVASPEQILLTRDAGLADIRGTFQEQDDNVGGFLENIGQTDPNLALDLQTDVAEFQTMIEDDLRLDLSAEADLTVMAGDLARKMAVAVFAEDQVAMEAEREKLEIGFRRQINAIRDQIEQLEVQKGRALEDTARQIGGEFGIPDFLSDPDKAWDVVYGEWAQTRGFNFQESADVAQALNDLWRSGIRDVDGAKKELEALQVDTNLGILMDYVQSALGLSDDEFKNSFDPAVDPGAASRLLLLNQIAANPNLVNQAAESFLGQFEGILGFSVSNIPNFAAALDLMTDADTQDTLDAFAFRAEFVEGFEGWAAEQIDQITRSQAQAEAGGRNDPAPRTTSRPHADETARVAAIIGRYTTSDDMVRIEGFHEGGTGQIHKIAAPDYNRMAQAAARDGITLRFTDTYRSYDRQARIYRNWIENGKKGAQKAPPDTSQHPRGLAIDFASMGVNSKAFQWMKENGPKYGWYHGFTKDTSEPWHWEYRGIQAPQPSNSLFQ